MKYYKMDLSWDSKIKGVVRGLMVSEKLKDAIEKAGFTGFAIRN